MFQWNYKSSSFQLLSVIKILSMALLIFLIIQPTALAFKPEIHSEITVETLNNIQLVVNGETLKFSQSAIDKVVRANKQTDDLAFQTRSELHFDNENFLGGSKRLKDLRERIIKKITTTQLGGSARRDLGGALHTIQDFYAHSNWVELGRDDINSNLGRETFDGAASNTATCPSAPGILNGEGLRQLTSGYFLFRVSRPLCDVPARKCRHGVDLLNLCPAGINKDEPSRPNFSKARLLAVSATKDFLEQIFEDQRVSSNTKAIKLLLGQS